MRITHPFLAALALPVVAACGGPSVELDADVFQVVHVSPHHGAVEVTTDVLPLVGFSASLSREGMESVRLEERTVNGYVDVDVDRVLRDGDRVVALVPEDVLDAGARYRIRVERGATSKDGAELSAELTAEFVTAAE